MKSYLAIRLLCGLILITGIANAQGESFDRKAFYRAMQSNKADEINSELKAVQSSSFKDKEAFEGALTMKKAGLAGSADKKLSLFKSGHKKLESAIKRDNDNAEYRFLRLMIQEHAPGILGYKNEMKKDSEYIRRSYKTLPEPVQQAVSEYSRQSKVLKIQDS